jgi:Cys-tRNA(Pro) deacylase
LTFQFFIKYDEIIEKSKIAICYSGKGKRNQLILDTGFRRYDAMRILKRSSPMKKPDIPVTPAVRMLRAADINFTPHLYKFVEKGGTHHSSTALGVPEHEVVKTLVMEAHKEGEPKKMMVVLMHGDYEVSTKQMARLLGVKTVNTATPSDVERVTGYLPGGVSPFGTRMTVPVYIEETILELDRIFINGGKRGFLVEINPWDIEKALPIIPLKVGIKS